MEDAVPAASASPLGIDAVTDPRAFKRPRKQVSRACDLCRARRIRCDNGQPCKTCHQRGAECTYKGDNEPRTLSMALREIDRLKGRIRELESELSALKINNNSPMASIPTPDSMGSSALGQTTRSDNSPQSSSSSWPSPYQRPQWEGIQVSSARREQSSYYGPASAFYFVRRIGGYLSKSLDQPYAEQNLYPWARSAESQIANLQGVEVADSAGSAEPVLRPRSSQGPKDLSRMQEESLLRLFWEGYYCLFPVLDEAEFREHYASLWETSSQRRRDSPLVDIIIAVTLQYSYAFIPHNRRKTQGDGSELQEDAGTAGRWHYRRAQSLLAASLESPSIATVQCYIFMMVYLCCASFHNMCNIMAAQAIRTAQVLGLHMEPPLSLPESERELRKRIWWALWVGDTKTSIKLGRPFAVDLAHTTVSLPSDEPEVAAYNGAALLQPFSDGITWLSHTTHQAKLFLTVVSIYDSLYLRFGESIRQNELACIYNEPKVLESCGTILVEKLPLMRTWAESLPAALKCRRRHDGRPFSTDRAPLDIDDLAPTWLTRQRVCLELNYHFLMFILTRPFITFYTQAATYTHLTERHATTCVEHAVTYTRLMHQVVTESDLLSGWSELFSLQWNAAITIVGFVLAYPIHPAIPRARQALDKAVAVFDHFGENFGVSADAAAITRDLVAKADLIAERLSAGITSPRRDADAGQETVGTAAAQPGAAAAAQDDDLAWLDPNQQSGFGQVGQLMDWALSMDSYNSFERFFDIGDPGAF